MPPVNYRNADQAWEIRIEDKYGRDEVRRTNVWVEAEAIMMWALESGASVHATVDMYPRIQHPLMGKIVVLTENYNSFGSILEAGTHFLVEQAYDGRARIRKGRESVTYSVPVKLLEAKE